ncbi:MAG: putative Ig domain-containing protein [Minisyncoccia bacterium]
MKTLIFSTKFKKALATYLMGALLVLNFPFQAYAALVTVDLQANGLNALTLATSTDSFDISVFSTNAASCQMTAPTASGISPSASMHVNPGDAFYPSIGGSVTFSVTCDDGTGVTASDSVVVSLPAISVPTPPTVNITANGTHGSITLTSPATYTYTWTSTNATSCVLTSPTASGISTAGTSSAVAPGSAFYPAVGAPVTITINCTDGTTTVSDSVVINLSPGGGGGGGSCTLPTINSSLTASGTVSTAFSYTVTTTSTSTPTYSIGASVLPTGLSFSTTTGVISGTPTQSGTFNINITTTNPCGTDAKTLVLTIAAGGGGGGGGPVCGTLPTINSSLAASGTVNTAFSYTITTTSTSTPNLSIGSSTLPVGLSFSSTTGIISGTPTQVETQNIIITATNPCGSNTQTLVITIAAAGGGGGGGGVTPPVVSSGGGGGSGGHRHPIVTTTSTGLECFYLRDYMRRDFNNDPIEVMKLQAFLLNFEGYTYVTVNGVFDQATFDAVSAFQMKYEADILTPWGHTAPTGYVYILTLKKVNEIYCQRLYPVTDAQQLEINAHRALLERLNATGGTLPSNQEVGLNATTTPTIPIIGELSPPKGQNISNIATALFAFPTTMQGFMQCLYEWLLILIVLYFLGDVLKDVLYKESEENVLKKFIAKWTTIIMGLIVAIIVAFIMFEWCLIFPLVVALILSIIWVSIYPKHDSINAHIKSWYIVLRARGKSMWIKFRNKNNQLPPVVSAFTADKTLMKVDEKGDKKTN